MADPRTDPGSGDPTLLQRVAAGEPEAVEALLGRYEALVWSIVRRQVPSEVAEDVVQEVFIDLWKSAARFDPALGSETTFVATVARRRLIDRRRRDARRPDGEALPPEVPGDEDPFEEVDVADEASRAAAALGRLRPEEQRVLELSIFGDLSHGQIAERTNLPLGTVKSQVRRGLQRVRDLLGATEGANP